MISGGAAMQREISPLSDADPTGAERLDADARLVARICAGDEAAFEQLVGRYQAPLFRYLCGLAGDPEHARDLLQETFLRAHQAIGTLKEPAMLRSWLYRIAHNQACSLLRRQRLVRWLPLPVWRHSESEPERGAVNALRVDEALARVPLDQRGPLLLHIVAGFSYAEIAALLQLSEGAVRMRISRGRAAFRVAYGAEEDDDAP